MYQSVMRGTGWEGRANEVVFRQVEGVEVEERSCSKCITWAHARHT